MRILADRAYLNNFAERFGFLPHRFQRTGAGAIWLHAVSVGEISSAVPLVKEMRASHPKVPVYISTTTVAGRRAAEQRLNELAAGVFYFPFDYVSSIRRVLRTLRPALVIILETEIWPNLYAETRRSGAALALVNARISNRTWPRYRSQRWLFCPVLRLANAIFPQTEKDRDRYAELGVLPEVMHLEGNLKYDAPSAAQPINFPTFGADKVWIAASTVGPNESGSLVRHQVDEDDIVIRAFQELALQHPKLLLILAPRQQTRFDLVAAKLELAGIPFLRRTKLDPEYRPTFSWPGCDLPGVLLLDSIGDLAGLYHLADVAFVGGSIAPRGGHNILEPAGIGVPVIVGPHMQNFEVIATDFQAAQAFLQIQSDDELAAAVHSLLADPARAAELGARGRALVEQKRGATRRVSEKIWPLYWAATPQNIRSYPMRVLLSMLAALWMMGGIAKRKRALRDEQVLPRPVLSVGGLTVGGSGKTPFTNYLASLIRHQGLRPAILTRGYRRRSPAKMLVFSAGSDVAPALTGDEAQIFLHAGNADIGIGADRAETGRLLLKHIQADLFLLDDGFQHARLRRDLDIVLIDGIDPFGDNAVVPLGRLREPLRALQRADILVVTRILSPLRYRAICKKLAHYNHDAPVFMASTVTRRWRLCRAGTRVDGMIQGRRTAAFCGLGNPQAFWNTLEILGVDVVFRWTFDDHHLYTPRELHRLKLQAQAAGADVLITTEKDRMNLPPGVEAFVAPLDIAWLEIEYKLDREEEFLQLVDQKLNLRVSVSTAGR